MAANIEVYLDPERRAERQAFVSVTWQDGPLGENEVNGALPEDALYVVLDRMNELNEGDFRCRENSLAITALEEALNWIMRRRINRYEAGVLGTSQPH